VKINKTDLDGSFLGLVIVDLANVLNGISEFFLKNALDSHRHGCGGAGAALARSLKTERYDAVFDGDHVDVATVCDEVRANIFENQVYVGCGELEFLCGV